MRQNGFDRFLSVQEAAYALLSETGAPMSANALAEAALGRGLIASRARDPVRSHAQTLEKNVRGKAYNDPPLKFVKRRGQRLLAIASWPDDDARPGAAAPAVPPSHAQLRAQIPGPLMEALGLATQARIADDFDQTVSLLLEEGLRTRATAIRGAISGQLDTIAASRTGATRGSRKAGHER